LEKIEDTKGVVFSYRVTLTGHPFDIFGILTIDLRLLVTRLVSSIFSYRFTPSGHSFGIFNLFYRVTSSGHRKH
jgi:hypothetical protein